MCIASIGPRQRRLSIQARVESFRHCCRFPPTFNINSFANANTKDFPLSDLCCSNLEVDHPACNSVMSSENLESLLARAVHQARFNIKFEPIRCLNTGTSDQIVSLISTHGTRGHSEIGLCGVILPTYPAYRRFTPVECMAWPSVIDPAAKRLELAMSLRGRELAFDSGTVYGMASCSSAQFQFTLSLCEGDFCSLLMRLPPPAGNCLLPCDINGS